MAAGLGFKDFTTGEVLTAADVDGYLMQGVWVFANAAARDAAVTSPQEGNFAYLKDTNVTTYYTGSAWANLDTTGMTNPMTTTGDIIYSSPGSTPVRLGIGSTGNVLTVAGGVPTWAAAAGGGGMTLLSSGSIGSSGIDLTSISGSYEQLRLKLIDFDFATADTIFLRFNGDSGSNYYNAFVRSQNGTIGLAGNSASSYFQLNYEYVGASNTGAIAVLDFKNYSDSTGFKLINFSMFYIDSTSANSTINGAGSWKSEDAITRIVVGSTTYNFDAGTYELWGMK